MKAKVSVTIEFPVKAPITWTGIESATGVGTIINRSVKKAFKENKGKTRGWSSLVAVILDNDVQDEVPSVINETVAV